MTVKKKIEKKDLSLDAMKYITEGGHVRADVEIETTWKALCVRIPVDFLQKMDKTLKKRIGISRNAWILEALQEKMESENDGRPTDN